MSIIKELLERYTNGRCNEAEKQHVEEWLASYNNHNDDWLKKDEQQQKQWLDTTLADIDRIIDQQQTQDAPPKAKIHTSEPRSKLKQQLLAAASLILVAGFALWLFMMPKQKQDPSGNRATVEILPGKNIATLLLENGSSIPLSEAHNGIQITPTGINYVDGSPVEHASFKKESLASQSAILQTPKGGQYRLILTDGTKIWLNAATSVTFRLDLTRSKERKITVDGEAYLEVAKMRRPFIVQSREQEINVLGTHFNVNSYPNEPAVKTTLLEGSVQVRMRTPTGRDAGGKDGNLILKPGEQAVLKAQQLGKTEVNPQEVVDWKDGDFILDDQDLYSIMRKVARWYNVEVVYNGTLQPMTFLGTISRSKELSILLQLLESNGKVHFKVKGRTITVSP